MNDKKSHVYPNGMIQSSQSDLQPVLTDVLTFAIVC